MTIKDISETIYVPGTASENLECIVQVMNVSGSWVGTLKALSDCPYLDFSIVEVRRIPSENTPIYNCPWLITVI